MTLRDEIAEIIQTIDEPWLAADDIMTAVREALLSDEALGAAASERVKYSGTATMLEAALDAAFGEGGER